MSYKYRYYSGFGVLGGMSEITRLNFQRLRYPFQYENGFENPIILYVG